MSIVHVGNLIYDLDFKEMVVVITANFPSDQEINLNMMAHDGVLYQLLVLDSKRDHPIMFESKVQEAYQGWLADNIILGRSNG